MNWTIVGTFSAQRRDEILTTEPAVVRDDDEPEELPADTREVVDTAREAAHAIATSLKGTTFVELRGYAEFGRPGFKGGHCLVSVSRLDPDREEDPPAIDAQTPAAPEPETTEPGTVPEAMAEAGVPEPEPSDDTA